MPRGKGKRGGGRGGKRGGGADRSESNRNERGGGYNVVNQTNETMESYYKAQQIIPEAEWTEFLDALKVPLPTTFRLTSSRSTAAALQEHIKKVYVPYLTGVEHEGTILPAPQSLDWYPNSFAWQLPVPKQALRKQEALRKFQHFLVYETDAGNISRQEAVSMIPPLLLDVQPGHTALDMCAAPGSKSVQILEALHGPSLNTSNPALVPQGLLIANDSDAKRCHLLVHQSMHRVPGTGMMVTNHDATQLPSLRLPRNAEVTEGRMAFTQEDEKRLNRRGKEKAAKEYEPMLFDRILADVPCSGDGTLRKNMGIWKDWTVGNGIGLHTLQLRILERGIAVLKPGGRLVYSTCSMNPMENESVVSAALSLHPEMSILPVPDELPGLKRRPGLTTWQVLDNNLQPAPHPDSVEATAETAAAPPAEDDVTVVDSAQRNKDDKRAKYLKGKGKDTGVHANTLDKKGQRKAWIKTLWPHGDEKEKGLEHSLRLYPHLQDTGAFFVCVLVKKADASVETDALVDEETATSNKFAPAAAATEEVKEVEMKPATTEEPVAAAAEKRERASSPVEGEPEAKKVKQVEEKVEEKKEVTMGAGRPFNEEPYIYIKGDEDEQVQIIRDFFDISPSFPFHDLLVRNSSGLPMRSIYLTSDLTRSLLLSNAYTRMRLISCGVKLFTRQDNSKDGTYRCKWRLNSEGLEVVKPYLSERRIVKAGEDTLKQVMQVVSVRYEDIKDEAVRKRMMEMEPGSAILKIEKAKGKDIEMEEDIHLAFWLSKVSCNLMVEKIEKSALSLRLYNEDITPNAGGKKISPIVGPAKAAALAAAASAAGGEAGDSTPAVTSAEGTPAAVETDVEAEVVEAEEEVEKVEEGAPVTTEA